MEYQKTIATETRLEGIGLHTGKTAHILFKPAPENSGIVFTRVDLPSKPNISANISYIVESARSPRRTSIGKEGWEIQTIEHLMAALWGLGIDNINIETDACEVPGLDGSSLPFLEVLKKAVIIEQSMRKKIFSVREPIWVEEGDAYIIALPSSEFKISYILRYDHPVLNIQHVLFASSNGFCFEKDIAPSRTFCLQDEADELRAQGLGKGATYENTLVVGTQGVINNCLRFENEFARHKILDLIGDLYLVGFNIKAHVIAVKSGHPLNIKLLQKLRLQIERFRDGGITSLSGEVIRGAELDISAIQRILPHRYPFLLVDSIIHIEQDKSAIGIKNVTVNEPFFIGHFPNRPIMPGVLIIEAMAQVAGVLMLNKEENLGKYAYFMSIDNARFRKTVIPGDQLYLKVEIVKIKAKTGLVHSQALVNNKVVAEADLMFAIVDG